MSKEDFDLFWRTHLVASPQTCHLPEVTVLYWHSAKEETSNFPWTRKEGSQRVHATAAVARDLITQVRVATRKNIITATLIQNYSPCWQCAEEILKIMALANEKRIKIDISIAFVALNRIRRPSWVWRGLVNATHSVTVNESNDNSLALRLLSEAGVKLFTFDPDSWKFLYTFLGNGFPAESDGRFTGGKLLLSESRFEEDRLTMTDFRQILKGLMLTSPSLASSNSTLDVEWVRPSLVGEKVVEYKIVCKKVTIKNKEDDDKSWRIQQTVDKVGVKTTVPGELSYCKITGLEPDTFYDVTVEAIVKGVATSSGRKLFRTGNKIPIPSLQTPNVSRKLSATSRSRTFLESSASSALASSSSSSSYHARAIERSTRLQRSNSLHCTLPLAPQSSETDSETNVNTNGDGLKQSYSGATNSRISKPIDINNEPKSGSAEHGLIRSNSVRITSGRPAYSLGEPRRRVSETVNHASKGINNSGKNDTSRGRKISSASAGSPDTTVL